MNKIRIIKPIGFVGGGNMTEAMIAGILKNKIFKPSDIIVSDICEHRRKILNSKYGISTSSDNKILFKRSETIFLALKPYDYTRNKNKFPMLDDHNTIISIMAGIKYIDLQRTFATKKIFRCMPNTAAKINKSVTLWYTQSQNTIDNTNVGRILSQIGFEQQINDEKIIEKATAIVGSGPAYVYSFIENMIDSAVLIGLNRKLATHMVINTIEGSVLMAQNQPNDIVQLRHKITSPGGTTAQALRQLDKTGFKDSINEAVLAAHAHACHA